MPSASHAAAAGLVEVAQEANEVVIRVRFDALASAGRPIAITQRTCHLVGLEPREFLELVRAGVIRGGRLPGRNIVMARIEDVLDAIGRRDEASAEADPVGDVLTLVGFEPKER